MCNDDELDAGWGDDGDDGDDAGVGGRAATQAGKGGARGREQVRARAAPARAAARAGMVAPAAQPGATVRTTATGAMTGWQPPEVRAVPNEMVRCALFRVANPVRPRATYQAYALPVQAARDGVIEYTGCELRQDDRAVFLELLSLEPRSPGRAVFRPRVVCEAMGWGRSNTALAHLKDCLARLATARLLFRKIARLKVDQFSVSLVGAVGEDQGVMVVELDSAVRPLFAGNYFTRILRAHHDGLNRRSYLAAWLLGYYASHREPLATTVAALQALCGDDDTPAKEFRRKLSDALAQLQAVGFLASYTMPGRGEQQVLVVRA